MTVPKECDTLAFHPVPPICDVLTLTRTEFRCPFPYVFTKSPENSLSRLDPAAGLAGGRMQRACGLATARGGGREHCRR